MAESSGTARPLRCRAIEQGWQTAAIQRASLQSTARRLADEAAATPPSTPDRIDPVERERQRFEYLVLAKARRETKQTRGSGRRAKRKPMTSVKSVTLLPGIEEIVAQRERWSHKANGTPQTHEHAHAARTREGSLARLYNTGAIDAHQLGAAIDIASVAERIGADVAVRTASLETRIDSGRRGDGKFYEALNQVRREVAYSRWRSQVRGPIGAVLDMIVGDAVGFTIVARRYRMHNRRAKQLLIDALDLWPKIYGEVRKQIDDAALDSAHAELLA